MEQIRGQIKDLMEQISALRWRIEGSLQSIMSDIAEKSERETMKAGRKKKHPEGRQC